MTRTRTAGALLLATTLLGCEAFDPAADAERIAQLESALIAPVGHSNPVTVRTWNFAGAASDVTIADGNVTNPTGKYTITWNVTPTPFTTQRTLSITRDESNGRLTVVARTEVLIAGGPNRITQQSTLTLNPHGTTTLTRWTQGQPTVTCPSGDLGPLVVASATCYEPLFDQRVLSRLPMARTFNGAPPANWLVAWAIASAYQLVYADHLLLWDTLRYRANLASLSAAQRSTVYSALQAFLDETGYAMHHADVVHTTALGDENEDWTDLGHHAGFFDGHRAYMFEAELWLTQPNNQLWQVPFRRTPAWIPTTVPAEFDRDSVPEVAGKDVSVTSFGSGIRPQDRPATICRTYATSTKTRLQATKDAFASINGWHGGMHVGYGGHFRDFGVTARTSLFWTWHTAVDGVWANLQRCYLDDDASL